MPQALIFAASAAATVFGGGSLIAQGAVSPIGPIVVDGAKALLRHTWPVHADSRKHLLDQVFAGDNGTGVALRRTLEWAAHRTNDEIAAHAAEQAFTHGLDINNVTGDVPVCAEPFIAEMDRRRPVLWSELAARGCYVRRTEGVCLDRVIGNDVAMVLDPSAPVRRGDPVMVAVRGLPILWGKIFVGRSGDNVLLWLSQPEAFLQVAIADVIHMDRGILIQPRDGAPFEPEPVEFPPLRLDDWTPPKMANLSEAHDAALMSIWGELRKLAA